MSEPSLATSLCGLELRNPVIAASGTFGYGLEFEDIVHLNRLGGFVVKGLSREPMTGNPPPRLYETAAGMPFMVTLTSSSDNGRALPWKSAVVQERVVDDRLAPVIIIQAPGEIDAAEFAAMA